MILKNKVKKKKKHATVLDMEKTSKVCPQPSLPPPPIHSVWTLGFFECDWDSTHYLAECLMVAECNNSLMMALCN